MSTIKGETMQQIPNDIDPQTAIIRVSPATDESFVALQVEAGELLRWVQALEITDGEGVKQATEHLTFISGLKKAVEEVRKQYVSPINEHLKAVNEVFRTISTPLETADRTTREKVLAYRREEERKAREVERINQLRLEAARAEMALNGEMTEPLALVEVPAPQPSRVRTDVGTLGTTTTRKWEVEDLTKVPLEYLMVDASKIGRVVRAGVPSIPGIRIWEEEGLRVMRTG